MGTKKLLNIHILGGRVSGTSQTRPWDKQDLKTCLVRPLFCTCGAANAPNGHTIRSKTITCMIFCCLDSFPFGSGNYCLMVSSQHLTRSRSQVMQCNFGVQETMLLVNHALVRGTSAIFVIFVVSRGSSSKALVLLVRMQIRHFRHFRQKPPFSGGTKARFTKSTVFGTPIIVPCFMQCICFEELGALR